MQIHYPTNLELVAGLEPHEQEFWLKVLDDMDRQEENYQRKMRYHQVSSLDFVVSEDGRETTLQELVTSDSYSSEDYIIEQIDEQLFQEAISELDMKHRIVFKAIFENGLNATKASQLVGRSDKTAKKYYKEACKQVLKKMQS
ncbi:TPA: sigma-70 family RNA polymerase sigma factor [Streptococcus suis]|nr:sigma-70 family RNA polymerase sigma factor [Streptococcus suis]NQO27973.1 sigma-70 family RNA polymerase sigma factor [Streptococcus suis]HEL1766065.1 sigma-70 family RNA polymerase sigma factor [Streptococcus suis]HEL1809776.1 sigma-70 family RNA polymerase sigma factor [Streptococcus suis]HEM5291904.1 sigma-70 family RNA polymerase sigma factor [Streptococcus suis]